MDSVSKSNLFPTNLLQKANVKISRFKLNSLERVNRGEKKVNRVEEAVSVTAFANEEWKSSEHSDDNGHAYENCIFNVHTNPKSSELSYKQEEESSHLYENVAFENIDQRKSETSTLEKTLGSFNTIQKGDILESSLGGESTATLHLEKDMNDSSKDIRHSPCRSGILFGYNSPEFIIDDVEKEEKSLDTCINDFDEKKYEENKDMQKTGTASNSIKPVVESNQYLEINPEVVLRENSGSIKRRSRKSTIISSLQELQEKQNTALLVNSFVMGHCGIANKSVGGNHQNIGSISETLENENKGEGILSENKYVKNVSEQQITKSIKEESSEEILIDADALESFYKTASVFENQDKKSNNSEFGFDDRKYDLDSQLIQSNNTKDICILNEQNIMDEVKRNEIVHILSTNEVSSDRSGFFSRPNSLYSLDSSSRPLSMDEEGLQKYLLMLLTENSADVAAGIMSVERRGTKALELWARRATEGYGHVSINNMTTSWRDGMAFCALVHRYRPELIEYSTLKPENILENNALAFRLAEQHLGIPALLDAEDMVDSRVPDRLSVLTYVSQYYQVMHQTFTSSGITTPKRKDSSPDISHGQSPTKIKAGLDTTPKTSITRKSDKVLTGGRGMVCVACSNPVFLLEKLMVGSPGQLMHRTCFRCARCSTQLTLASYYETEKGQYCCETCPDEERFIPAEQQPSSDHATMTTGSKTSLTHSDNVDPDDSDEDESIDSESTTDCATSNQDVHDTISDHTSQNSRTCTPEPLKPRSVFLSKEMLGNTSETDEISHDGSSVNIYSNNLSQVGSLDFEAKSDVSIPDIKTNDSNTFGQNDCDNAKGYVIDPPESNSISLSAGQGQSRFSKEKGASIVSQRLKLFMDKEAKSKSQSTLRNSSSIKSLSEICKEDNAIESIDKGKVKNSSVLNNNEKDELLQYECSSENICESSDKEYDKNLLKEHKETCKENESDIDVIEENKETYKENESDIDLIEENKETYKENDIGATNIKSDTSEFKSFNNTLDRAETNESYKVENTIFDKENLNDFSTKELLGKNKEIIQDSEKEFNPFDEDDQEVEIEINDKLETKDSDIKKEEIKDDIETQDEIIEKEDSPEEYPDDLNPFGDDDDNDIAPALPTSQPPSLINKEAPLPTIIETSQSTPPPKPKRTVITANINPFEDDEDDEDEEDLEPFKKLISAGPSKASLNPFWSDDEELPEESGRGSEVSPRPKVAKPPRPPPPTLKRNSSPSTMSSFGSAGNTPTKGSPDGSTTPRKRTGAPPRPPSHNSKELFPQDNASVTPTRDHFSARSPSPTPSTVSRLKKKSRAPAPPPGPSPLSSRASVSAGIVGDTTSINSLGAASMTGSVTSQGKDEEQDEIMSWKHQKDMKNQSNKRIGSSGNDTVSNLKNTPSPSKGINSGLMRRPSLSKSEAGEWQRKKGPAPPRPVPQKRAIKKLPMKTVQTELGDIEIKQTELERQGVLLETAIRSRTESPDNPEDSMTSSGPSSIEVEDMILQLFELVNEKNELFRRQTELMYLKREKRLEEEYAELEYQIRCLMVKPPSDKDESDTAQEEELIGRLVKIVEQRDEIINCLELDRLREAQEDESIANHMMLYQEKNIDGVEHNGVEVVIPKKKKILKLPKKKKKKKEEKKGTDKDKDVDEIEAKENKKKKKKWFI